MPADPARRQQIEAVLERSRALGHLGKAPITDQIDHALAFAGVWDLAPPRLAVDLGAGGGVPGLVLAALVWPSTSWLLIEVRRVRADLLREAVAGLGLGVRVTVAEERAEALGRQAAWRSAAQLVTARSFGPPAVVAECAAPFLGAGGRLIVSEPPASGSDGPTARWPEAGLGELEMAIGEVVPGPPAFVRLDQRDACPERYPRRPGRPERSPLF